VLRDGKGSGKRRNRPGSACPHVLVALWTSCSRHLDRCCVSLSADERSTRHSECCRPARPSRSRRSTGHRDKRGSERGAYRARADRRHVARAVWRAVSSSVFPPSFFPFCVSVRTLQTSRSPSPDSPRHARAVSHAVGSRTGASASGAAVSASAKPAVPAPAAKLTGAALLKSKSVAIVTRMMLAGSAPQCEGNSRYFFCFLFFSLPCAPSNPSG